MSAAKPATPPDVPTYTPPPLPPGIVKALRVFKANFPELLEKHRWRVAACDAERVLFIGDDQEKLYARCRKRGLLPNEFVVLWIAPDATEFID